MNLQPNFNTNKLNKQEVSKQWMEEIGHLLPKKLEELASSTDTIQRKQGIKSACDLLKILLLYAVSGMNFKFLALCADALGISSISDTAWRKKMQKAGKWLKEILDQLLHGMATPDLSPSCTGRDVYLIDGPTIRQQGKGKSRYVSICLTI